MKCPKCGYVSHDYLDACRKCSIDLVAFKHEISLAVLEPGLLDLTVRVGSNGASSAGSANGNGGEYDKSDSFLGGSMLVETEVTGNDDEEEVDIRLDDDAINAMSSSKQAPGSLTREFFVPDELLAGDVKETGADDHRAMPDTQNSDASDASHHKTQDPITEEILNLDFDDETVSSETFFTESVTDDGTDVIDMNALQELRDAFSEPEDVDVEDVEPAIEPEDSAASHDDSDAIDLDSASFDLDATLLEEGAVLPPSDPADSQSNMIQDESSAQSDSMPLQDAASEAVSSPDETPLDDIIAERSNASGSLDLPEDFQLGDFQADDAQPQDRMPDQPQASGSLDLPEDFQLGDFQADDAQPQDRTPDQPQASGSIDLPEDFQLGDSTPAAPAVSDQPDASSAASAESVPPPDQDAPEPEEKITLSLPIDPNTETLFFDQISDTSGQASPPVQETADSVTAEPQDPTEPAVEEEDEPPDTIPFDELSSELLTDDLMGAESTLELNLELELPTSEPLVEDKADEVPVDLEKPDANKDSTQS